MTYKVLVCVNLSGGNDSLNTFVPINNTDSLRSYTKYSAVRGPLAIAQNTLIPMNGINLGVNPNIPFLAQRWNAGKLALIHNVGPITALKTVAQVNSEVLTNPAVVPSGLFSHSDQTYQWDTAETVSTKTIGWGGSAAEQYLNNTVVQFANGARFGDGANGKALDLPLAGATFTLTSSAWQGVPASVKFAALESVLLAGSPAGIIEQRVKAEQVKALQLSQSLQDIVSRTPGSPNSNAAIDAAFGNLQGNYDTPIAKQLYQVAKFLTAEGRSKLAGNQHIFYVRHEGFDNHGNQLPLHTGLLQSLNSALTAFNAAVDALSLQNNVTVFSTSEFGRTFAPNLNSGTDHAWGATHFVYGGSVRGGYEYGVMPELTLGGPNDIEQLGAGSRGRFLPTLSVSQYAATLLKWASPASDMNVALPNLAAFAVKDIGFMSVVNEATATVSGSTVVGSLNTNDSGITSVTGTLIPQPSGASIGPQPMVLSASGSYDYTFTSVPDGTYILRAQVTSGVTTAHDSQPFTVASQSLGPVINSVVANVSGNTITGVASIAGTGITNVQGTLIRQSPAGVYFGPLTMIPDGNGSYSASFTNVPAGTYVLQVDATNSAGTSTVGSGNVTVTVVTLDPIISVNGSATSNGNSPAGEGPSSAFDGNTSTKFLANCPSITGPSTATNPGGLELTYTLAPGVTSYATSYQLGAAATNRDLKDFRLQGYNGSAWVTLDSRTNEVFLPGTTPKTYFISGNTTPIFTAYRLVIDQNNGSVETGLGGFGIAHVYEVNIRGLYTAPCVAPTLSTAGTTSFTGTAGIGNSFSSQVLPTANPATPSGTWSKVSGPTWASVAANGAISITSGATAGTTPLVREYNNGCLPNLQQTISLVISNASVAPDVQGPLPTATVGQPYSATLTTIGSPTAITVTMPSWLSVAFISGVGWQLTGTPPVGSNGTPNVTFSMTNASTSVPVTRTLPLTVAAAPVVGAIVGPLTAVTAGVSSTQVLSTTGGVTGIQLLNNLPTWAGLTSVAGNQILQTNPPAGTTSPQSITFLVKNANGAVQQTLPLTIGTATSLAIVTPNNWSRVHGQINTFTHTASGGTPPYTWSISNQDAGVTVNSTTGVVTLPASLA